MKIETKPFGLIEIDERQVMSFPQGILGFEQHQQWALLDSTQPPFYWLQSLSDPSLAFVLISPSYFRPDYDPDLSAEDRAVLGTGEVDDILQFAIVTIPEDQNNMTANLQGPILINRKLHRGKQGIQTDPRWKVRHRVVDELASLGVR